MTHVLFKSIGLAGTDSGRGGSGGGSKGRGVKGKQGFLCFELDDGREGVEITKKTQ